MKRIYIGALLCLIALPCLAQFKLSGKVLHAAKRDTFFVDIPFVFGFSYLSKVPVVTDSNGRFTTNINVARKQFVRLTGGGFRKMLLLKPGGTLQVNINLADTNLSIVSGSVAAQNRLLNKLGLEKPAFFWGDHGTSTYNKLSATEVRDKIFEPLLAERERRLKLVTASTLSVPDKKLIAQEVRAQAINNMSDFTTAVWRTPNKTEFGELMAVIFKDGPPKPDVEPAGPKFYAYADQYISFLESDAFIAHQKLSAAQQKVTPLKYYGVTLDSGRKAATQKGKLYINWLAAKNGMGKNVAEHLLAQFIFDKTDEKVLFEASALLNELKSNYPHSRYLPFLAKKVAGLQTKLAENSKNADIHIIDGYNAMTSIYQVIDKLKGKVVYLDVWGTWCGPCKEELKYNPLLKEHFKGKEVAFVYLDMDDDAKDAQWRDFLRVNSLTGWHLRKNRDSIKPFWDELMADKSKQHLYPTYFIFDKDGKLVEAGANRPSFKDLTYKQIEKYL